jgi:hypothetical protein
MFFAVILTLSLSKGKDPEELKSPKPAGPFNPYLRALLLLLPVPSRDPHPTPSNRKKNPPSPYPHIFNTQKDIHPTQPFLLPATQTYEQQLPTTVCGRLKAGET